MKRTIQNGDSIKVEYTGTFANGEVFDSSAGREPLEFTVGKGEVIPGFERAVVDMEVQEEKTFTLKADDAYGSVRKEMMLEVPRHQMPATPEPEAGMELVMKAPDGNQTSARIIKVDQGIVTIDVNHPLAGKELTFKIKVVAVTPAG